MTGPSVFVALDRQIAMLSMLATLPRFTTDRRRTARSPSRRAARVGEGLTRDRVFRPFANTVRGASAKILSEPSSASWKTGSLGARPYVDRRTRCLLPVNRHFQPVHSYLRHA